MNKTVEFEITKIDSEGNTIKTKEGSEIIEKHSVTMKRLSYGEKVALEEECMEVKIQGTTPLTKVNTGRLRILGILKSISKTTLPLSTVEDIKNLPSDVGDLLFQTYVDLNQQNPK